MRGDPTVEAQREEPIDPSWWAPALKEVEGAYEPLASLTFVLEQHAQAAADECGIESLRARTLLTLAHAASPMLQADDWVSPFRPMAQVGGRRSVIPEDLTLSAMEILTRAAPLIDLPALQARTADIAWTYGDRSNRAMVDLAISSYLAVPLTVDAWLGGGGEGYRRAFELGTRQGQTAAEALTRLGTQLLHFVLAADGSERWVLVEVSELLAMTLTVSRYQAQEVAEHLTSLAERTAPSIARGYLRQAAGWLRGIDQTQVYDVVERIAELYVEEAEIRLSTNGGAMVASLFLEKAISTVRSLPRKYRSQRGIEPWLAQLRASLAEMREWSLEEMEVLRVGSSDISTFVDLSQKAVSCPDRLEAVARLADIAPLIDAKSALGDESEHVASPLVRGIGTITFSSDARKVAVQEGTTGQSLSPDEAFRGVVSTFAQRINLIVQAQIYPALEVVVLEHRFDLDFLARLCFESPAVPSGHEYLWARGLLHGLSGDFASAISILVPQMEELVRRVFKGSSVFTLHVDDEGIEKEKSLGVLLEMPDAARLLGPDLTLELRALLCEQVGPNLRNDLAHGLLTDPMSQGASAVYAWWHCLRLVVFPYYNMEREQPSTSSSAEPTNQ